MDESERDDSGEVDSPRGEDANADAAIAPSTLASTPLDLMAQALLAGDSHEAAPATPPESPATASEMAVRFLMRDLVRGALPPGHKLKLRELTQRYRIGASPMREALAQLASGGFVQLEANKGFRVAPVSLSHLVDITETRQIVGHVPVDHRRVMRAAQGAVCGQEIGDRHRGPEPSAHHIRHVFLAISEHLNGRQYQAESVAGAGRKVH